MIETEEPTAGLLNKDLSFVTFFTWISDENEEKRQGGRNGFDVRR